MEEEKRCENCEHFYRHYTKSNMRFSPLDHGHCSRKNIVHCEYNRPACRLWESNEEKMKYREERIISSLKKAAKSINEICEILKY